jgi:hypothetical protein
LVPQVITGLAAGFKHFGKFDRAANRPVRAFSICGTTTSSPQRNAVFRISPIFVAVGAFRHDGAIIIR